MCATLSSCATLTASVPTQGTFVMVTRGPESLHGCRTRSTSLTCNAPVPGGTILHALTHATYTIFAPLAQALIQGGLSFKTRPGLVFEVLATSKSESRSRITSRKHLFTIYRRLCTPERGLHAEGRAPPYFYAFHSSPDVV